MRLTEEWRSRPSYLHYARMRYGRERILDKGTDIVIEGYPRSANTFAYEAFKRSNPGLRVAHHVHSVAQVLEAERLGVPCIVLVRDPRDAVPSWMVYEHCTARAALQRWLSFHEPLLTRSGFVMANFGEVVADLGSVVERVNAMYGSAFVAHTPDEVETHLIQESIRAQEHWQDDERRLPVPSATRAVLTSRARELLGAPELSADLRRACVMWAQLMAYTYEGSR